MNIISIIVKRLTKVRVIFIVIFLILLSALYINSTTYFRLKLVGYYLSKEDYDKAITLCKKAIRKERVYARSKTLNISQTSEIYYRLFKLFLIKGELIKSVNVLKELYMINPSYQVDFMPYFEEVEDYKIFGICLARAKLYDSSIEQFQKFIALKKNDFLIQYYLALLYQKQGMQEKFEKQLEQIIRLITQDNNQLEDHLPDYLGDCYYNLALKFEEQGERERAVKYYKMAIEISGDRLVNAYYRLEMLYKEENKLIEAEAVELELSRLTPMHEGKYKLNSTVMFLGYSINKREFELFNIGKITFFWKIVNHNSELTYKKKEWSSTYKINNRLYEIKKIKNLAPNFGFEIDHIGDGFPHGWATDIYANNSFYCSPIDSHQIIVEENLLSKTQCLLLTNTLSKCTNSQSDFITVDEKSFYLQAGRIKSAAGNAYFGRRWFDSEKNPMVYHYVATKVKSPAWNYYVQVATPPHSSAYCCLWVINYENQGKAYFDDILFIELQLPELIKN
jgi:tetratricopeptide (TPR) repeat protein